MPTTRAACCARLSGRRHDVLTGICLRRGADAICDCVTTGVIFATLSDAEIHEYVASGEPMDKAGAYAIQGLASKFVERIEGDYFNVMGLPVALVYRRLHEARCTTVIPRRPGSVQYRQEDVGHVPVDGGGCCAGDLVGRNAGRTGQDRTASQARAPETGHARAAPTSGSIQL